MSHHGEIAVSARHAPRLRPYRRRPALGVLALLGLVLSGACNEPVWYIGPNMGGEEQARRENKPLMLYFKSWDSSHHLSMKKNVFDDAAVKKELIQTINIELEYRFFPELERKYGVTGPQVCVMCDPNGRKVGNSLYVNPAPSAETFLQWISSARTLAAPPPKPATAPAAPGKPADHK